MARQPAKLGEKAERVLGFQHAADKIERALAALLQIGDGAGDRGSAMRIVSAVEPDLRTLRSGIDERAACQTLQASRPFDRAQSLFDGGVGTPAALRTAQRRDGDGSILDLVAADQARQGQIEQSLRIGIDHSPMFLMGEEILTEDIGRC